MNRLFVRIMMLALVGALFVIPAAAQEDEKITIRFVHAMGWINWLPEEVEPAFEEAFPQYDLELIIPGGYVEVIETYGLAQEQGDPPELVQVYEAGTQEMRDTGYFKPIHEAIEGLEEVNGLPIPLEDIFPPVGAYYQVDGEYFSMPWNTSTPIIYANMDLLVEAGIAESVEDIDAIPETWGEVDAACAAIAENTEADCITWGFGDSWIYEQTMGQMGELLVNNDNGRSGRATEHLMNSETSVKYLTWWSNLENNGHFIRYASGDDSNAAWANSELAFQIGSSAGARGRVDIGNENGFTVRAGRMPYADDIPYVGNLIGGATIYLTDGLAPEVEEGALMFMNFFSNPENAADWHRITGYIPITESAVELLTEEGWFEENPNSRIATEQLATSAELGGNPGALIGNFVAIRDVITGAIEDILVNDLDVAERLEEANEEANQLLEEYNLIFAE